MRRLLFAVLLVIGTAGAADAQTTRFACDFQDTPPFSCTYPGGAADMVVSGTPGVCGVNGADWAYRHVPSGGYNGRGYVAVDYCTRTEGGATDTFPTGFAFISPGGLDPLWPPTGTFYAVFRVFFETGVQTGTNNANTIKWMRAHQNVFDGDQRLIVFFEQGGRCGTLAGQVGIVAARNINAGGGPGNCGTDAAFASCPLQTWCSVQIAWQHGPLGTSFLKVWVNNDNELSPTAQDLSLTASPTVPGGTTWARDNTAYQGDWHVNGASVAGGFSGFTTRFTLRLSDWRIRDGFDRTWASGGDGGPVPPAPPTSLRLITGGHE